MIEEEFTKLREVGHFPIWTATTEQSSTADF